MAALRIVGFASGSPQSQKAMARLGRDHHLAAIVVPPPRRNIRQFISRALGTSANPLTHLGIPIVHRLDIARFRPDVIVVASFPRILPAATIATAKLGALNMHMSLLPRHRGVDPIFSTYWDDDRDAGVTIHWMNEGIDAGDIAAQKALPLQRGRPSRQLYMHLADVGVEILSDVLGAVASGNLQRQPQDRTLATHRSSADIARAHIPFAEWPAERVWHVLSGLGDQFHHLVPGSEGMQLTHGRAERYAITRDIEPGRIVAAASSYELHCRDGLVFVRPQGQRDSSPH